MPNSTTRTKVRPWKHSLLNKEGNEDAQVPVNYFDGVIRDTDVFSIIMEDINTRRKEDELLEYTDMKEKQIFSLNAFLIIQDKRGVHWVCPIDMNGEPIDQVIRPIDMIRNEDDDTFDDKIFLSEMSFGSIVITRSDYLSACSRGFENASLVLLGNQAVTLDTDNRLVAAYYIYPKS